MSTPELFLDDRVALHCGDSRDVLRTLPDASIDSVVCDPPYALVSIQKRFGKPGSAPAKHGVDGAYARAAAGFMGQGWDTGETAFAMEFWREVLRVLKPGGHVLAFGGTRSYHRLTCAIEDAGFEIRDSILELVSLDPIVRAFVQSLDEAQLSAFLRVMDLLGIEGLLAWVYGTGFNKKGYIFKDLDGNPAGPWGGALKPAWEPIILARKPLSGTVAENVLEHGTGALNIDGCRVPASADDIAIQRARSGGVMGAEIENNVYGKGRIRKSAGNDLGRWPANVMHDGSDEVLATFPESLGQRGVVDGQTSERQVYGQGMGPRPFMAPRGDTSSAARFFYSAKADADDRIGSKHPTVKPVDLMRWLVRLVTPPGGTVLDPFAGTGTTGEAAWREGFSAVLIEREPAYQADVRRRMALCLAGPEEKKRESIKARHGDVPAGPLFEIGEPAA
ncbi:DNA methyltransferase [Xanthobacter sp. VTT E-85241]|uniref:DNA-methyltransferase n=1 Tax=Roseixanthobacter finlandensis TaxID=3119922 RepID=UPI00372B14CD